MADSKLLREALFLILPLLVLLGLTLMVGCGWKPLRSGDTAHLSETTKNTDDDPFAALQVDPKDLESLP